MCPPPPPPPPPAAAAPATGAMPIPVPEGGRAGDGAGTPGGGPETNVEARPPLKITGAGIDGGGGIWRAGVASALSGGVAWKRASFKFGGNDDGGKNGISGAGGSLSSSGETSGCKEQIN